MLDKVEEYYHTPLRSTGHKSCQGRTLSLIRGVPTLRRFHPLKPWDERTSKQDHAKSIIGGAFREFAKIPGALVLAFNAPSIRGLGATGGFSLQLQDPSGDFKVRRRRAGIVAKARQDPAIGSVSTSFRVSSARAGENQSGTGQSARGADFKSSTHPSPISGICT